MRSSSSENKNYNGNITFLFNENGATLELEDEASSQTFVRIELTADQILCMFSRQAYVKCDIETYSLDRVGKKMLMDQLEFELPAEANYHNEKEIAIAKATEVCPDGWIPDNYFGSKNSFFYKGGKRFARATIRKWVLPDVTINNE